MRERKTHSGGEAQARRRSQSHEHLRTETQCGNSSRNRCHFVLRDANHRLLQCVGLGVRADAVHFQKGERGGGTGPFVAVDISLRLGDVKGVGSREIVKIGPAVEVKLLRLKHGRLQPSPITPPGAIP